MTISFLNLDYSVPVSSALILNYPWELKYREAGEGNSMVCFGMIARVFSVVIFVTFRRGVIAVDARIKETQ
jgi:hypothetical protein